MADRDDRGKPTAPAGLAGAAAYLGLPHVLKPLLDWPSDITDEVVSGRPIAARAGTPLEQLAEFTGREARAIQAFAQEQGVRVPILSAHPINDPSSFFARDRGAVDDLRDKLIGKRPSRPPSFIGLKRTSLPMAFHEVGHGTPVLGSHAARRALQATGGMLSGGALGHTLRGLLLANVLMPPGEDASALRQKAHEYAPHAMAATFAPEIVEEARASMHALKGARRHGPGTLKALKELAPALGTYVASAAAPVLGLILARKIVQALHAKNLDDDEKTAADIAQPQAPGRLKVPASVAWKGATPPKPKTTRPSSQPGHRAEGMPTKKPAVSTGFYKDMIKSMREPGAGARTAVKPG